MINNQTTSAEELIDTLSDESKHILMRIGVEWRSTTGNSASYVSPGLLVSIFNMQQPWTQNKLKTKSEYGLAGIKYGVIPMFVKQGLLVEQNISNKTYYDLTEPGREILRIMISNCDSCDNTRICARCEGHGFIQDDPCNHVNMRDCTSCKKDGKDEDGDECWACDATNDICSRCNPITRVKYCEYCTSQYNRNNPMEEVQDVETPGACSYCRISTEID
tara:strand:+ start:174 stop:830 length:657 start_codon:yes stop_codon:yes gene_type:complete